MALEKIILTIIGLAAVGYIAYYLRCKAKSKMDCDGCCNCGGSCCCKNNNNEEKYSKQSH